MKLSDCITADDLPHACILPGAAVASILLQWTYTLAATTFTTVSGCLRPRIYNSVLVVAGRVLLGAFREVRNVSS